MKKNEWDNLVIKHKGEFLQSWDWGEFQQALGKRVIRFYDEFLGLAQVIITQLPFGLSWAYVPRGPIFFDQAGSQDLIEKIIFCLPKNVIFISFEPTIALRSKAPPMAGHCFSLKHFKSRQPEQTLVVNLTQSDQLLYDAMKPNTRYSIRVAQKKNLSFQEIRVDEFYGLLNLSARRQNFKTYSKKYFETSLRIIDSDQIKIFGVKDENSRLIAAALFYLFGQKAVYLHAGSLYEAKDLMGSYFLQWEIIKYLKSRGFKCYDLWGIDQNRWPGLTHFKTGFGGEIKNYPGAYVKALKPIWFRLYNIIKKCI